MDRFFIENTILICPDKLLEGQAVAQFLKRRSLNVARAPGNATELLERAREKKPVLIIFSDEIEGMTPREISETIRGDAALENTRILLLTEQLGDSESEASIDVDARLVAPFDDDQVIETIGALLEIEVRKRARVTMQILAGVEKLCEDDVEGAVTVVNVLNLSETGLLVESPFHLKVGACGSVRFRLPGGSDAISSQCRVTLCSDELTLQYGIEFEKMSDEKRKAVRDYVSRQPSAGGGVG